MEGETQDGNELPGADHAVPGQMFAADGDGGIGNFPAAMSGVHDAATFDPTPSVADSERAVPRASGVHESALHERVDELSGLTDNLSISQPNESDASPPAQSFATAGELRDSDESHQLDGRWSQQDDSQNYMLSHRYYGQQQPYGAYASSSQASHHQAQSSHVFRGHPNSGFFPVNDQTGQSPAYGSSSQGHSNGQLIWSDSSGQFYFTDANQPNSYSPDQSSYPVQTEQSNIAGSSSASHALYNNNNKTSNDEKPKYSRHNRGHGFFKSTSRGGSNHHRRDFDGRHGGHQGSVSEQEVLQGAADVEAAVNLYEQYASQPGQGTYASPTSPLTFRLDPETSLTPINYSYQQGLALEVYPTREFTPGRVFITDWSEPMGSTIGTTVASAKFYEKQRRFVIAISGIGHSICLPITSYSGQGCRKIGVKQEQHGIVYSQAKVPVPHPEERYLGFQPIQMIPDHDMKHLKPKSRINYAKPRTIEHNVAVQFIGCINNKHVQEVAKNMFRAIEAHGRTFNRRYSR